VGILYFSGLTACLTSRRIASERRWLRPAEISQGGIIERVRTDALLFAGEGQRLRGRAAIAAALIAIRQALDTPGALPGFGP